MSRGVFDTPRPLGNVTEIVPISIRLRRPELGGTYTLLATMAEGEEQPGGRFLSQLEEKFYFDVDSLSATDKTIVERFLKLIVREYASQKGYTVTVP